MNSYDENYIQCMSVIPFDTSDKNKKRKEHCERMLKQLPKTTTDICSRKEDDNRCKILLFNELKNPTNVCNQLSESRSGGSALGHLDSWTQHQCFHLTGKKM